MTPATLCSRPATIARTDLPHRIRHWLTTEIEFIAHPDFRHSADAADDPRVQEAIASTASGQAPADLPAHLRRMCEVSLLTPEQETALFRAMNYLKYRANAIRAQLDPAAPNQAAVDELESLLARADEIRNHIIQANMRLVISIVKKFVTPQQSFDDMLSDGTYTLMQAVDKFDFSRGFRFSTYAYRAIARNAYRSIMNARKEDARFAHDVDEWAFEQQEDQSTSPSSDRVWSRLRALAGELLERLDRRERFIIRSRYALGSHRKVRTFQYLAEKLGISKERVRQLEQRALVKLNKMASEFSGDELFTAAMA